MKIHLGCGRKPLDGYTNVDILPASKLGITSEVFIQKDAVLYLTEQKAGSVEEIMAEHFIEHLPVAKVRDLLFFAHQALKEGGLFKIVVPFLDKPKAWVLSHESFYTEETFFTLQDKNFAQDYRTGHWNVEKLSINSRQDIHVWMRPVK